MTRYLAVSLSKFLSIFLAISPVWAQSQGAGAGSPGSPATLQIQVVEGDGATYSVGSRATRGVTVLITDETGKPVSGATVNFTLPDGGPSGVFTSGTRAQLAMTQGDGKAAVWGMQWNHTQGPFEIRVTASKGQARAGTIVNALLSGGTGNTKEARVTSSKTPGTGGSRKWLWIGLAVAGAAAAGAVALTTKSSATTTSQSGVTIGTPTVTLGH